MITHFLQALESWSTRFGASPGDVQLKLVQVCVEIGIECSDYNQAKRPDTGCILESLDEMESIYGVLSAGDLLSTPSETKVNPAHSLTGGHSRSIKASNANVAARRPPDDEEDMKQLEMKPDNLSRLLGLRPHKQQSDPQRSHLYRPRLHL
jgi:hypothetical protein